MLLPLIWLAAAVVFAVLEANTLGLTSVWFAFGSLAALLLSLFHASLPWQIGAFLLVSVVMLLLVRPLSKKYFQPHREKTNADRVIGMKAVVTQEISNLAATGQVKVAGQVWTARAARESEIYPVGATVTVRQISGVKLIVE